MGRDPMGLRWEEWGENRGGGRTNLFTIAWGWPWIKIIFPTLKPPKMGQVKGTICGVEKKNPKRSHVLSWTPTSGAISFSGRSTGISKLEAGFLFSFPSGSHF